MGSENPLLHNFLFSASRPPSPCGTLPVVRYTTLTRSRGLSYLFLALSLLAATALAQEPDSARSIAQDVDYQRHRIGSPAGNVTVHMVLIDLDAVRQGRLSVEPALGGERIGQTASPSGIARRVGALAALNGPYFASTGGRTYPLGFTVLDGRITQLGNLRRPLVGLDPEGEFRAEVAHPQAFVTSDVYFDPIWLWSVNSSSSANTVSLYDRRWADRVSPQRGVAVAVEPYEVPTEENSGREVIVVHSDTPDEEEWNWQVTATSDSAALEIPADGFILLFRGKSMPEAVRYRVGAKVAVYAYDLPSGWESMRWITTLGPWFVHEGCVRDFSAETTYGSAVTGRASRSAIGTTWNDEIFFAVTQGAPVSIQETARVLIECNVREAVMCDSGSSSGLWASGVGAFGHSTAVPLAFVVRELESPPEPPPPLKTWLGTLQRH